MHSVNTFTYFPCCCKIANMTLLKRHVSIFLIHDVFQIDSKECIAPTKKQNLFMLPVIKMTQLTEFHRKFVLCLKFKYFVWLGIYSYTKTNLRNIKLFFRKKTILPTPLRKKKKTVILPSAIWVPPRKSFEIVGSIVGVEVHHLV